MSEKLLHLPLRREEPQNRRRARGGRGRSPPDDPAAHGRRLAEELAKATATMNGAAFDDRALLKLRVASGVDASDFEAIPGVEVVSQEGKEVVLLFAAEEGLLEFRGRLDVLARAGHPTRQDLLFAIQGFDRWTRENRLGRVLRREGTPPVSPFLVDAELWPLERSGDRKRMIETFDAWCKSNEIEIIDTLDLRTVVLRRLRVTPVQLEQLLDHRDLRCVDLPPSYQIDVQIARTPIAEIPIVPAPAADAPGVVCLDSGLAAGHPLLASAVGDAQSFLPGQGPDDENGHGTLVAGLALYGDVDAAAEQRSFIPVLRVFSGRIINADAEPPTKFVEKALVEAVEYFVTQYRCRVFNLSFGDRRRTYAGGHVDSLAAVVDELAREHGVLIVVSAGNFVGEPAVPQDWRAEYPTYLKDPQARIIDPAPALNALTVGSLARYDLDRSGARYPLDPAYQSLARPDEPSPFTRCGPGPNGAIKPELVEYGGNWAIDVRTNHIPDRNDLGELSTNARFVEQGLFARECGTSFAAPKVAHLAARLLIDYPNASASLLRALLLLHAEHPEAATQLLEAEDDRFSVLGYGRPRGIPSGECSENCVTLYAEDSVGEDAYHFYEIPLPEDFVGPPAMRPRRIRVALAHTPMVRRTRIDYRMSAMAFRTVRCATLDEVVATFRRAPLTEQPGAIPETGAFSPGAQKRDRGTAQAAVWKIERLARANWDGKRLFVVVSRRVPTWAAGLYPTEPYALAVALEDRSEHPVRLYTQLRLRLGARVRLGQP
jgi:hypothetical protein